MREAASNLKFEEAAKLRDLINTFHAKMFMFIKKINLILIIKNLLKCYQLKN